MPIFIKLKLLIHDISYKLLISWQQNNLISFTFDICFKYLNIYIFYKVYLNK